MTRRMLYLPALVAAAALLACLLTLLVAPGEAEATFPGQNGKLVYAKYDEMSYDYGGLHVVNPDGTGRALLTGTGDLVGQEGPAISPDGTKILFAMSKGVDGYEYHLYIVNIDGTGLRKVIDGTGVDPSQMPHDPAWSPDGSQVAFSRWSAGSTTQAVWVMNPDGSGQHKIVDYATGPAWSPRGDRIAFQRGGDIYTVNPEGADEAKLTDNGGTDDDPDWSPDGTKLAFSRYDRDGGRWGIYVMNADGTGQHEIPVDVSTPNNQEFKGDKDPAWSPDGKKVAFSRDRYYYDEALSNGGRPLRDVFVANADGSGTRAVYTDWDSDTQIDWQPLADPGAASGGAPETTIILGPSGPGDPSATFDFVSSTPGSTFECSLDGAAFASCEGPKGYADLPDGQHDFRVRAKGPGEEADPTPAERTWTVDTTGPAITCSGPASGSATRDRTPTVRATVRDGESELAASGIKLHVDGVPKAFSYDPDTNQLSRTTNRLSYGRHRAKVVAEDALGNVATRAWSFKVVRGR